MAVLSITASAVLASSLGVKNQGVASTTITQGQALYLLANNTIGLADANGSTPANSFLGFSLNAASSGQPVTYVGLDPSYTVGATLANGGVVWLDSTTPGAVTQTYADVASGSTVIAIGVANSTTTMNLLPVTGGTK